MYSCNSCSSTFKLQLALQNHMKTNHEEEVFCCVNDLSPFNCSGCGNFQTHFLTQLKQHIQQDHTFHGTHLLYTCRTCRFETFSMCVLLRHFYLSTCVDEPLKVKGALEQRLNLIDVRVIQWFKCEYCAFQAQFKGNLRIHQRKFHRVDTKWLKCDLCSFNTSDKMLFDEHIQFHIEPEEFPRLEAICTKEVGNMKIETSYDSELDSTRKNQRIPQKHKKFKCQFCGYQTNTERFLPGHVKKKHRNLGYFYCGQCSYKARRQITVKRHILAKHVNIT